MTENQTEFAPPPPSTPPMPRQELRRTTGDDDVFGGVAGGVARWLGIDPILVRVAVVLLAVFGGTGVVIYAAGWLFIPEDGSADSIGERFFRNSNWFVIAIVVFFGVAVVGPMLIWGLWGDGPGFGGVVLLFLVIAAVVALTRRGAPSTVTAPTVATETLALPQPPRPPKPPKPPKERSVLGRLTIGSALLVAGTLVALDVGTSLSIGPVTVVAALLAVVAIGLLVGAFIGRSRGLIVLGVILVLVLIPLGALPDGVRWNAGEGTGVRVYRITSPEQLATEYQLGAGKIKLDLRHVELSGPTSIDISVGVGALVVLLPDDVPVTANADVAVGVINFPGEREANGMGVERDWQREGTGNAVGSLNLTLSSGLGSVEVTDDTTEVVR